MEGSLDHRRFELSPTFALLGDGRPVCCPSHPSDGDMRRLKNCSDRNRFLAWYSSSCQCWAEKVDCDRLLQSRKKLSHHICFCTRGSFTLARGGRCLRPRRTKVREVYRCEVSIHSIRTHLRPRATRDDNISDISLSRYPPHHRYSRLKTPSEGDYLYRSLPAPRDIHLHARTRNSQ